MQLRDYLTAPVRSEPHCGLFVADWVVLRAGIDPGAADRDLPAERQWGWGGLPLYIGRLMRRTGLARTNNPRPGDVGVIAIPGRLCCAIKTDGGWAMRIGPGVSWVRDKHARPVAAWRII